jgi:hypothetical protein
MSVTNSNRDEEAGKKEEEGLEGGWGGAEEGREGRKEEMRIILCIYISNFCSQSIDFMSDVLSRDTEQIWNPPPHFSRKIFSHHSRTQRWTQSQLVSASGIPHPDAN